MSEAIGVFKFFENLLDPTAATPEAPPPSGLLAFYWYYARQVRGLILLLFVAGFLVAELDTTIPIFIGRMVGLLAKFTPTGCWPRLGRNSSSWPWSCWCCGRPPCCSAIS